MPAAKETVVHIPVSKLKTNPWQSEVGPPLSDADYAMLRESVERHGIQIPLIAWRRGKRLVVLSGSNRLRVARELGLATVPVIIREFEDKQAARMFALSDNLARRQLTTGQRAYLAYQFQQLLTVGKGRRTDLQPSSQMTKVDARETAAKRAGVSEGTVSAIKKIVENGDDELLQCIVCGKLSVSEARELARSSASIRRKVLDVVNNGGARKKVSRLIREATIAARKASARRYASTNGTGNNHDILHGDMKLLAKRLKDGSVKMFLTDPPYAKPELYGRLAALAAAKLKPGGLCLPFAWLPTMR